ncbi:MAG: hypothetical protein HQK55_08495, partial [Deltaproteobacteria bacterium]|nr:hypothetical protein [Deltaproteobacteria bacterium]
MTIFFLAAVLATPTWGSAAGRVEIVNRADEAGLAHVLTARAESLLTDLEKRFGLQADGRISIILVSSREEFARAQPLGASLPVWAAGVAYPDLSLIIIQAGTGEPWSAPEQVLSHEVTHLVLGRLFGRNPVPDWLNEGLTMHLSGDWGWDRRWAIARAMISGRLIPLEKLIHKFPEDRLSAETAYAQSFYFITFLMDRFGRDRLAGLIRDLGMGVNSRHALIRATGLRETDLQEQFYQWLNIRFSPVWFFAATDTWWAA